MRRLKASILAYLSASKETTMPDLIARQFNTADNMTDSQSALAILADLECHERNVALQRFYDQWRRDPLVLDKWFSIQADSSRVDTVERVAELTAHVDFSLSNPNRVRSLLSVFAQNQVRFHRRDGAGYGMMADYVLRIDPDNPQLAARLVSAFNNWRRFDNERQSLMHEQLQRIAGVDGLSKDVAEIVDRALDFATPAS
jgi:aminopeptidase N